MENSIARFNKKEGIILKILEIRRKTKD